MRVPRLRAQLAIANAIAVLALMTGATVLLTSRSDELRRAEAVTGTERDAEVLSAQVAPHITDRRSLDALTSPNRSRRTEVVAPNGARLAGANLMSDHDVVVAVSSELDDTGVGSSRNASNRFSEAIGVDSVVVHDELLGAVVVVEPLPPERGWRQLFGLDLPAATCLALLAALVGWWLAGRISRPLDKLTEQARALVLTGETLAAPPSRIPEIATLRAAMARLSDRFSQDAEHRSRIDAHLRRLSHELRTPLTTIRLRVEALPSSDDGSIDLILEQLERLDRLGGELAQLRSGPRETQPVDLGALVIEAGDRLRPLASWGHIELRVDAPPGCIVTGEKSSLSDAIVNVIENAVKFSPPGGLVSVRVTIADAQVWVEVTDAGPGIAAHLADAIVQPAVRIVGLQRVPGSGQGLAIVAATVDRHHGTLELNTAPTGGALVRIGLPALVPGTAGG